MVALINTALMRTVMATARLRQRFSEERGQDLLEYAILGGAVVLFIGGFSALLVGSGAMESMACGIAKAVNIDGVVLTGC